MPSQRLTSAQDDIDRHQKDDTIGTLCPTDKRPARAHHVGYDAHSPNTLPHKAGTPMIVVSIVGAWLTLTALGFVGLSVLAGAGEREEQEASKALAQLQPSTLAEVRRPIPKTLLG